jgi:hypothetical protein
MQAMQQIPKTHEKDAQSNTATSKHHQSKHKPTNHDNVLSISSNPN